MKTHFIFNSAFAKIVTSVR